VAFGLLAASGITSAAGNALIYVGFPDRPAPEDLILRAVGPYVWAQYITEVAIISSLAVLALYIFNHARAELAEMTTIFAVMYLIRSVIMVLTPLANSYQGPGSFGFIPLDQLGMLPSGHVAAALFCIYLIDARRAPHMKHLAIALFLIQIAALLLSHGHYSIDIVGGALLGYFVFHEWREGSLFTPLKKLLGNPAARAAEREQC
jgi:membrane-associated phospholipid phosphatase